MDFTGTLILDGHSRFPFDVVGKYRRTRDWQRGGETVEGDLVLTVTRVPYFPGPILVGDRGILRIAGSGDLPIVLSSVDSPRMNLRSRSLEFSVGFAQVVTKIEYTTRNRLPHGTLAHQIPRVRPANSQRAV